MSKDDKKLMESDMTVIRLSQEAGAVQAHDKSTYSLIDNGSQIDGLVLPIYNDAARAW